MADGVRYRFLSVVGEGGFGRVYRVRMETDDGFNKDVAVKILGDVAPAAALLKRFRDEAKILGLLRDRAIVSADPPIQIAGRWAVVMEFVDGVSLGMMIGRAPVPPGVAVEIVGEVARSLHHAWNQEGPEGQPLQLLHRDIKPENIQITPSGEVKLLDFGIARANFKEREFKTRHALGGTPGYIAPERTQGVELPAGDVYSLGVVLHEAVTGIRPRYAPTVEVSGHTIHASDEDLELGEHHHDNPELMEVVRLAAWMRADEAGDRPAPREVEDWCRRLRQKLSPPYLREWAETEVPHRNELDPDEMIGRVVTAMDPTVSSIGPTSEDRLTPRPAESTTVIDNAPPSTERSRLALGALVGGGVTLIAVLSVIVVALLLTVAVWSILGGQQTTSESPAPEARPSPAPDGPEPALGDTGALEPSPSPAPSPGPGADEKTPSGTGEPPAPAPTRPRTVVVLDPGAETAPDPSLPAPPDPAPADVAPAPAPAPAPAARTGTVLVRTIPSGGTVEVNGAALESVGGGYVLPVGRYLLRIVSPSGEETRVPVVVENGATIPICYNFDTNSACAH